MDDELLAQFLIESRELVQQATEDLLALEASPGDTARIDSAFRAVHSLKGAVGLFDFAPMGAALHAAEDVLDAVRRRRLAAGRGVIDVLLACMSASEDWIEAIAHTGSLPARAAAAGERLRGDLLGVLGTPEPPAAAATPNAAGTAASLETAWLEPLRHRALQRDPAAAARAQSAVRYTPNADCFFLGIDPLALVRAIPDLLFLHIEPSAATDPGPVDVAAFDPFACTLRLTALSGAPADAVRQVFRLSADQAVVLTAAAPAPERPQTAAQAPGQSPGQAPGQSPAQAAARATAGAAMPAAGGEDARRDSAARSLRVDAGRIDAMADIVGELIVAKNALAHLAGRAATLDPALARALAANQAEIDRLTGAMHRAVMGVRMMPLARSFQRLPRLVREIASQLGRDVAFEITGGEVEADKAIVDGLFEPLLHVLRNALDHGIENPAARLAAGKPAAGRVMLAASRAGEQIVITVSDDGGGIDTARVRQVAKARGLLDEAAIDALDERQAAALIFAPGFSTAAAVSGISGRGVGMDVVRSAVEGLGGRVTVESALGRGTSVRMALPQAAMLTTVMAVRAGGEQFGVPIEVVAETVRVPAGRIVPIRGGAAFVLRDRTMPVLNLAALLGLRRAERGADARLLIVATGAQLVGLEVDSFAERADVLLRPMTGLLAGMRGMLGHALLGDGKVLMVLDLPELIA
jgi:two-component system chemotaxis sensor kinase CheA